jgi:membrane protease YdiL (CAAX protease family)
MTVRDKVESAFQEKSRALWFLWAGPPILCIGLPGFGVLPAGLWIILLMWLGRQRPAAVGFRWPVHWRRRLVQAIGLAAGLYVAAEYLIDPFAEWASASTHDLSQFADLEGNWGRFLAWLALTWLVGAVLEELVFRGFFLQYGIRLFGEAYLWPLAVAGSSVFGLSHLYQGPAGVISTGIIGLLLATVFILSQRSLVLVMLVHGGVDTIYFVLAFLGVKPLV